MAASRPLGTCCGSHSRKGPYEKDETPSPASPPPCSGSPLPRALLLLQEAEGPAIILLMQMREALSTCTGGAAWVESEERLNSAWVDTVDLQWQDHGH